MIVDSGETLGVWIVHMLQEDERFETINEDMTAKERNRMVEDLNMLAVEWLGAAIT